jgi:DNA-directed RNA polymerase specialized sigma24 family protein
MMSVVKSGSQDAELEAFVRMVEPRLRQALVATYGPADGREATVDALSWAWENWDRVREIRNPIGYLYRVGQSSVRSFGPKPFPVDITRVAETAFPEISPELIPALHRLSPQQRTIVFLVHAHGWSQADVADLLDINPSTVREHLNRAVKRLREDLEVHDVR